MVLYIHVILSQRGKDPLPLYLGYNNSTSVVGGHIMRVKI